MAASTVRRTHSEDIKERMKLLEVAMAGKTQWTRGDLKPIDKNDPDYGKPQKGTWTAERGQKAHNHVHKVGSINKGYSYLWITRCTIAYDKS